MFIYNESVVVWTKDGNGRIFNDVPKADKYFAHMVKADQNPCWERIIRRHVEQLPKKRITI